MATKEYLFFVCTTPFQLAYVNEIVKLHFFSERFYKVLYSSVLLEEQFYTNFDEVYIADKKMPITKILVTYKAIKRIKSISKNNKIQSFFSHTGGLVANFSYQSLVQNRGYNFSLYYEGVLSFYKYKAKKSKKHIARKLASFFYGFKYFFCEFIVPLDSVYLNSIFTPFPEMTLGEKGKMSKVVFDIKTIGAEYDNNLILGGLLRSSEDIMLWSMTIRDIKNRMTLNKVFVKKHPDDKTDYLINLIIKEGIEVVEIVSLQPVEFLIQKYKIKKVFSIQISSALFNLQAIYGEDILLYYKKGSSENLNCVYDAAIKLGMNQI